MYRLRWSRRLSESKYLMHWSLCQKSKLELKTDVEAELGLKARQSWVYRLSTQDAWLQATFEALRVVTEAKLDYFLTRCQPFSSVVHVEVCGIDSFVTASTAEGQDSA